jgi:hypothetical protein
MQCTRQAARGWKAPNTGRLESLPYSQGRRVRAGGVNHFGGKFSRELIWLVANSSNRAWIMFR